jgi:NTP pyrophosphatase (non-canonical NTP hydrolase)
MTIGEYELEVMRVAHEPKEFSEDINFVALGLTGESGEVADIVKKWIYSKHPLDREHLKLEMGDILYYLVYGCLVLGITLEDLMELNTQKLRERYPNGFNVQDSIERWDTKKQKQPQLDLATGTEQDKLLKLLTFLAQPGHLPDIADVDSKGNETWTITPEYLHNLLDLYIPKGAITVHRVKLDEPIQE